MPIGAFLCSERIASAIEPGDHGTTFGGNPLVCAAACATIAAIEEEGLLQAATEKGAWIKERLHSLALPGVVEVRGEGLMLGLQLDRESRPVVVRMMELSVLANATAGNVVRWVP
ncbi:aminotransferase class III-fold pyridoxal phosphate-dependent enzyme, partial [Arthrospira platensis SPKY1]|nr:aminotransferase class III-fold pyridoxal phosphate-dependent enzyme [Arthrospira platensis SPKY1]